MKEPKTVSDLGEMFEALTTPSAKRTHFQSMYNSRLPCLYIEKEVSALHGRAYAATIDKPDAPLKRLQ